jgi:ankyrin repeat protein
MHRFMLHLGIGISMIAASACSAEPTLPLAVAAARNATDLLRTLLSQNHDPDERDANGVTPLMWAARSGSTEAMTILLDGGADPGVRDVVNGWTALFHAIHRRQAGAVRLLLDRGVDPDRPARMLRPLAMAAADRDPTILELLLAHGADPSARGIGGSTALSVAVSGGSLTDLDRPLLGGCNPATVRALLKHDPTLRLPDSIAGREALWWARFHGCADVLKMIQGNSTTQG